MATRIPVLTLWLWAGWGSPAAAEDPPDAALSWAAAFDQTLPQYKHMAMQFAESAPVGPTCAVTEGCEQLSLEAWSLLVIMEPQDRRRFSPARVRIHPLQDTSAEAWLDRLEGLASAPGQASVAGIGAGDYWVELIIPCTVGSLLPYEAVDLIGHIKRTHPELSIHPELAWSPCAQRRFEKRSLEWVQAEALIEREQWGIVLPQGRVVLELPD